MEIACDAAILIAEHSAELAERPGSATADEHRRAELLLIAAVWRQVAGPRSA
jgi:hypothetical protein